MMESPKVSQTLFACVTVWNQFALLADHESVFHSLKVDYVCQECEVDVHEKQSIEPTFCLYCFLNLSLPSIENWEQYIARLFPYLEVHQKDILIRWSSLPKFRRTLHLLKFPFPESTVVKEFEVRVQNIRKWCTFCPFVQESWTQLLATYWEGLKVEKNFLQILKILRYNFLESPSAAHPLS
jgi:hypothetical protein